MVLSLSMILARLLGLLYVIPFQQLVGPAGLALYAYAYAPYSLFLTLSTLGIPVGIAKFISKYNADGAYDTSRHIFRLGMFVMIVLGIVCFFIMWFGAPWMASRALATAEGTYNSHEDVVRVIRTVSLAVIVIPPMSILRGFFQGNQDMTPTAVSQIIEQLVRVILIVVGSFTVIRLFNGTTQMAVTISVFSAVVAGVISLYFLYQQWLKKRPGFNALLVKSVSHSKQSTYMLFKELLSYALPFAVLSLVATWFQLIDTVTFNNGMIQAGVEPELAESIFGIYATALSKVIMVPVSFAIAFGQPLVTEVTEKMRLADFTEVHRILTTAILLTSVVTLPAVVGMALLSTPIYVMLFNRGYTDINVIGGAMFGTGAFIGFFLAFNSIIAAIIQGIGRQYKALVFLVVASVIKWVGNLILIPHFEVNGAIWSTMIAYAFCIVMNYVEIQKTIGIQTRLILKRHLSICVFVAVMAVSVWLTSQGLNSVLDYTASRGQASLYVLITGLVGGIVYVSLVIYFDLGKLLFGDRLSYARIYGWLRRKKT
ncbi:MAG: polysaccharide biosynthesis protein [Defluviitaleaceae bacterium]|nr:polysaccharide biosynthesis protein [Defluviitaleaceae bacterium]